MATEIQAKDFGDFLWGAATSAYQIEGSPAADGKVPSIWDVFSHRRRKIARHENADIACDHYRRWREDLAILAEIGFNAYRFSLSWPRLILANGRPNPKGIEHYRKICEFLLERNIRPFVTLYHWDLPQWLEDKGGWAYRGIVDYFADYAAVVAKAFGDLVNDFIVLNEPMVFLTLGYLLGVHAPGRRSLRKFFAASHHALLAQAEAARALKAEKSSLRVGTTISATAVYPASGSKRDVQAAERFDAIYNTFYLEPVLGRGYPTAKFPFLRRIERFVQAGDMERVRFDFSFWGINTYTRQVVRASRLVPIARWRQVKNPTAAKNCLGWEVFPRGLYDLLKKYAAYPEIRELIVTENGYADEMTPVAGRVVDHGRIHYHQQYLAELLRAQREGVPVKGYFVWSLLDNFEWAEGFRPRFGLVYVDYLTGRRFWKDSAFWWRKFLTGQ
ncbi:MAG: GH1 family beta-glucosidase [Turneriella sp.]|nr:GH1 family beta-glucosidase [Leptospiraceae bacterium]MCX7633187.1 GH1 family beta-glucosidase [Turneriella sp.]